MERSGLPHRVRGESRARAADQLEVLALVAGRLTAGADWAEAAERAAADSARLLGVSALVVPGGDTGGAQGDRRLARITAGRVSADGSPSAPERLVFPLAGRGSCLGSLALVGPRARLALPGADRAFVTVLAALLGLALDRDRELYPDRVAAGGGR